MIRFDEVHKAFGGQPVLCGVSLSVQAGSVHFVIGRSGAGKSVLIKQVVGLLVPDRGGVFFDGIALERLDELGFMPIRRRCQMIFQHATLFDALTVLENIAMPVRKRFGVDRREANARARDALEAVDALMLGERYPPQLGAGLQKRVAIARAVALQPEAILYDEPTTGLDPVAARRIDRLIRRMCDERGMTALVVSHDLHSVLDIADRVTLLQQGRVAFDGTTTEMAASAQPELREFLRRSHVALPKRL